MKLNLMKVLCIDDKNRPHKISEENWIKEGQVYTVIEVKKMGLQNNSTGFKLAEVSLPEKCFPYEYFRSSRFGMLIEIEEENEELSTETAELDLF